MDLHQFSLTADGIFMDGKKLSPTACTIEVRPCAVGSDPYVNVKLEFFGQCQIEQACAEVEIIESAK